MCYIFPLTYIYVRFASLSLSLYFDLFLLFLPRETVTSTAKTRATTAQVCSSYLPSLTPQPRKPTKFLSFVSRTRRKMSRLCTPYTLRSWGRRVRKSCPEARKDSSYETAAHGNLLLLFRFIWQSLFVVRQACCRGQTGRCLLCSRWPPAAHLGCMLRFRDFSRNSQRIEQSHSRKGRTYKSPPPHTQQELIPVSADPPPRTRSRCRGAPASPCFLNLSMAHALLRNLVAVFRLLHHHHRLQFTRPPLLPEHNHSSYL